MTQIFDLPLVVRAIVGMVTVDMTLSSQIWSVDQSTKNNFATSNCTDIRAADL